MKGALQWRHEAVIVAKLGGPDLNCGPILQITEMNPGHRDAVDLHVEMRRFAHRHIEQQSSPADKGPCLLGIARGQDLMALQRQRSAAFHGCSLLTVLLWLAILLVRGRDGKPRPQFAAISQIAPDGGEFGTFRIGMAIPVYCLLALAITFIAHLGNAKAHTLREPSSEDAQHPKIREAGDHEAE